MYVARLRHGGRVWASRWVAPTDPNVRCMSTDCGAVGGEGSPESAQGTPGSRPYGLWHGRVWGVAGRHQAKAMCGPLHCGGPLTPNPSPTRGEGLFHHIRPEGLRRVVRGGAGAGDPRVAPTDRNVRCKSPGRGAVGGEGAQRAPKEHPEVARSDFALVRLLGRPLTPSPSPTRGEGLFSPHPPRGASSRCAKRRHGGRGRSPESAQGTPGSRPVFWSGIVAGRGRPLTPNPSPTRGEGLFSPHPPRGASSRCAKRRHGGRGRSPESAQGTPGSRPVFWPGIVAGNCGGAASGEGDVRAAALGAEPGERGCDDGVVVAAGGR